MYIKIYNLVPTAICLSSFSSGETYGRGDEVEKYIHTVNPRLSPQSKLRPRTQIDPV